MRILLMLAAFVIVIAGMRAAETILVPFLLSLFIAIIASAPLVWLQRRGLPTAVALLVVVLVIAVFMLLFGAVIGQSINNFTENLPEYQTRLQAQMNDVQRWLGERNISWTDTPLRDYLNVSAVMRVVGNTITGLGGLLTNGFLITLTIIFLLLEASSFPDKLRYAFGKPAEEFKGLQSFTSDVRRYIAIKAIISLGTGMIVAIFLAIVGLDYPLLWGLLAFLLNFIPNIGSILAAIPPILLALVQTGLSQAFVVAIGYFVVNFVIGNIVEPRFMGRELGLSTLVVFVSLVFWGWVLGPVGMLLAVPLTMTVKIALQSSDETRWLAILLGSRSSAEASAKAEK
jgi:predicted PurR-regulated permease PerM